MKPIYLLNAIDSHTAGEPTRVVLSGIPKLMGHTMMEKRNYFMQHYDFLRTAIINKPRGHESMYCAVITPPTIEEAEFGQFFMCPRGYPTMCGHGTIGVVTVMIETGAISYSGSSRTVIIDTPVGIVEAKAEINDGEVKEVMIKNIPSFLLRSDVSVDVKGLGKIQADIAFAGNFFYAQVDADKLQLSLDSENKNQLISLGLMMREAINQTIPMVHPEDPEIKGVSAVDFFGKPTHREAHYRDIPGCLKSLAVR